MQKNRNIGYSGFFIAAISNFFQSYLGMLRVGITGGIGSGKSTVTRIFEVLGIPVYDADRVAKQLMESDPVLRQGLMDAFGASIFVDGKLQRAQLASMVFGDEGQLNRLNQLVHPVTLAHAAQWMKRQDAPYVVKEAALIFESGAQADLDLVIGVYAPQALRIQRVMKRDGVTRESVLARMSKQLDESVKMKLCDVVIHNDEQSSLIEQVMDLHQKWIH